MSKRGGVVLLPGICKRGFAINISGCGALYLTRKALNNSDRFWNDVFAGNASGPLPAIKIWHQKQYH
eukprot:8296439-Pyramimonas_sp.AAC.1